MKKIKIELELTEFQLLYLQRVAVKERFRLLQSIEQQEKEFAGDKFGFIKNDRLKLGAWSALFEGFLPF